MKDTLVLIVEPISPREQEVLEELAKGDSNAKIAVTLFLSEATVKIHVRQLLAKLGATNRTQMVLNAQEIGLVATPGNLSPIAAAIAALIHAYPAEFAALVEAGALDEVRIP